MQHMILVILYFVALISCSPKSLFNEQEKVITDFPKTIKINGEKSDLEIIGVNNIFVIDTFLIAYTAIRTDDYFQVYSSNDYTHLGNYLPVGRGAHEFYAINYFNCYEKASNSLWLQNTNMAYKWNLPQSIVQKKTIIDSTISLRGALSEVTWLNGNKKLIGLKYKKNSINYQVYNNLNNEITIDTPLFAQNIPRRLMPLTTMDIQIKPDKSKIIISGWYINNICVYNTNYTEPIYRLIYEKIPSLYEKIQLDESERKVYYSYCQVTDRYIYALYLNQAEKDRQYHTGNEEIHVFDWEANPILKINIPENIMSFTLDEKQQCLYGLTSDEKIYKYDLSEYLTIL